MTPGITRGDVVEGTLEQVSISTTTYVECQS
jgi:hypothetical protein